MTDMSDTCLSHYHGNTLQQRSEKINNIRVTKTQFHLKVLIKPGSFYIYKFSPKHKYRVFHNMSWVDPTGGPTLPPLEWLRRPPKMRNTI